MHHLRSVRIVAPLAALILLLAATGVSLAQEPHPVQPRPQLPVPASPPPPNPKHPKFASSIAHLLNATQRIPDGVPLTNAVVHASGPPVDAYIDAGLMRLDHAGRVQVYIRVTAAGDSISSELNALGAILEMQSEAGDLVQARIPIRKLPELARLPYVKSVTLPDYGYPSVGSKLTEGDALLDFDDLRATLGVDGSGVVVGVISDGIFGLSNAIASGDLPATTLNRDGTGKLTSTTGGVIAHSFRADQNLEGGLGGQTTGAEGTAMLEIVHDIAPAAQLRFANFTTSLEFMAAVDFLAANSDVVVDDIAFFAVPYDQTSDVSTNTATELNKASNPIRGYFNAVGNQAMRHYQENYVSSGIDGAPFTGSAGNLHRFAATSNTTDCLALGPRNANLVGLGPGQTAAIFLTWNDSFSAPTTDYDLYVNDNSSGAPVVGSFDDNPGVTRKPVETVVFTNNSLSTKFYDILIQNFGNASAPVTFDMFVMGGTTACSNGTHFNYNTLGSSVPAQSDAGGGVVSVGAINASDPGADEIASYSSRGPANNGVIKPDVVAIDGIAVTGSGGFSAPFFGTSAAAPHVAGLAALLLDLRPALKSGEPGDNPSADRTALRAAIVGTAIDLGVPGVDNTYGSGRVNGLNSGQSLQDATPTPTPSPTPTPVPVPSLSTWGILALAVAFGLMVSLRIRNKAS